MSSNYPPNYLPNYPPQQRPPAYAPAVAKRKSGPWLWLLAGCGTLLVIAVIAVFGIGFLAYRKAKQAGIDPGLMQRNPALASAKVIIGMNPDLEIVSTDEENGTLTIREKKTGETITANIEEIQEGKISFKNEKNENVSIQTNSNSGGFEIKTDKETVKFGGSGTTNLPDWLPAYPGVTPDGIASMNSGQGRAGTLHFVTQDTVDDVLDFYEVELKAKGLKVTINTAKMNGQVKGGTAAATDSSDRRNAAINASATDAGTEVYVTYRTQQ